MRYDAAYRETRALSDGSAITLRLMTPDDRALWEEGFSRLSRETRYRRFLAEMPVMTLAMARYLTDVDDHDRVAIVATRDSLDLKREEGLGLARFHRLEDEPHIAEAAVTVIDDHQGKGIGKMLLEAISAAAVERGIKTFRASVLAKNEPMRRILDASGGVLRRDEGDTLIIDVPLRPIEARWSDMPIFQVLRAAAEATRAAFTGHA